MNIFDALNPEDFISQGDVFLMEHDAVDGKHYMVVLNLCPESSEVLVLGVLTTQIDKRRCFIKNTGKDPQTLVEFEYLRPSAVDCNNVKEIEKSHLRNKIHNKEARVAERLPEHVVRKIVIGVILGTAPQRLKNLVQNIK
jgi:hypothetical protein